jgi:hypothetical protein
MPIVPVLQAYVSIHLFIAYNFQLPSKLYLYLHAFPQPVHATWLCESSITAPSGIPLLNISA